MAGKLCVSLTHAKDDADRSTIAFVIANAALGSDQETTFIRAASACVSGYRVTLTTSRKQASPHCRS